MDKVTALALLNNQLRRSDFNFSDPEKKIYAGDNKIYTLKELIKIAYNIKENGK